MDYAKLLECGFHDTSGWNWHQQSRLEYLSEFIFEFTTYDSGAAEHFAGKALEVCAAINDGKTFDYIEDPERYQWYLLMVNMPFFAGRLDWGTSIRGAWWDHEIEYQSCGLFDDERQVTEPMKFTKDEWTRFIAAMIEFAKNT